ncbi:LAMI_0C08174g1_1 [Lachancea mirantina]|uniref:tRNA (adenine(58)-N(1))-methyltransferase non-catalytic subunit TRM6 n=1 Tax=Lachancea mirantina TaxID=1230905 RepID=A0A1G4J4Q1_9SACH|nr:LAMI_0C08174g1_1 [Lachancea mirantina]
MATHKRINIGEHVVLRLPSNNFKVCELRADTEISLGKFGAFRVNDIIGYPLGTTFQICYDKSFEEVEQKETKNKAKTPAGNVRILSDRLSVSDSDANGDSETDLSKAPEVATYLSSETNKNLINVGNKIQKLTMEEIEELKKQSVSGEEIIAKMIEAHGSFHHKTVHSQEKYLKRKKQKFAKFFTVESPTSSALLQYLIDKNDVARALDLSQESLGIILSLANVRRNGTYLCVDETGGLLVYAMLERMFGGNALPDQDGKIILVHENEHPNIDLLKFSNYSEEFIKDHVKTISLLDFFEPPGVEEVQSAFTPLSHDALKEMKSNRKGAYYRRLRWYENQLEIIDLATKLSYDGLVVGSTLYLPDLVLQLSTKVHGSRPIVCYSQFKETLLELSHVLYGDLRFLAPTILETRCRPYQTIRGKLHPLMTMRGGGGYIMWCQRVIPVQENDMAALERPKTTESLEDNEVKKQKVE